MIVEKSLESFLKRIDINTSNEASGGFMVLKNIRGGYLIDDSGTNGSNCENLGTCTNTNSNVCFNNRCSDATNTGCHNTGTCFS
jgi:hypothetical protein